MVWTQLCILTYHVHVYKITTVTSTLDFKQLLFSKSPFASKGSCVGEYNIKTIIQNLVIFYECPISKSVIFLTWPFFSLHPWSRKTRGISCYM